MRPSQMGRLTRADFHLQEPIPYVSVPRGKRGRLAAVPLVDEAVAAGRAFIAREAFGPWSTPSANKAIRTAARKAKLEPFTVYQIRHSFATWLRHAGADLADIQDLYGHRTRRRRGSTRPRRSPSSAMRSSGCVSWPIRDDGVLSEVAPTPGTDYNRDIVTARIRTAVMLALPATGALVPTAPRVVWLAETAGSNFDVLSNH